MFYYIMFTLFFLIVVSGYYFMIIKNDDSSDTLNLHYVKEVLISTVVLLIGSGVFGYLFFNKGLVGNQITNEIIFILMGVFLIINVFSFYQVFIDAYEYYAKNENRWFLIIISIVGLIALLVNRIVWENFAIVAYKITNMSQFLAFVRWLVEYAPYYLLLGFILFILIGSSNAVNLTDGLDGLAGGLSAIAFIAFSLISLIVGFESLGIFTLVLTGSLIGFLIYNTHPARIFMGDSGSLSLGALMGAIAVLTHKEITLLVVAFVFVVETLSVIIQVIWMRLFYKKLFLMTPLHHHFEKLGWKEADIVKMFWVIGLSLTMLGIYYGVWL